VGKKQGHNGAADSKEERDEGKGKPATHTVNDEKDTRQRAVKKTAAKRDAPLIFTRRWKSWDS
jgi:hypothetical protein